MRRPPPVGSRAGGRTGLRLALLACGIAAVTAAARPAPAAGGRARFERVAVLGGWNLTACPAGGSPWSADGTMLAVDSAGSLAVFDATRPGQPPRTVLRLPSASEIAISWSPDGHWLACGATTPAARNSFWMVPASGGSAQFVVEDAERWPFFWASDGYVYAWERATVRRFAPPEAWRAAHPDTSRRIPGLAPVAGQGMIRITPGRPPQIAAVPKLGRWIQHTRFADGRRFLFTRSGAGAKEIVTDADGAVLGELDGSAHEDTSAADLRSFSSASATADGGYVAGFYEVDSEDGERIARAPVFLTDTLGRARLAVEGAPYSTRIECAPRGRRLALGRLEGGVEVGTLEIGP